MDNKATHPSYYQGEIECIRAIEASMSTESFEGFLKGNIIKYIWRYKDKGLRDDLNKALDYLNWLIDLTPDSDN